MVSLPFDLRHIKKQDINKILLWEFNVKTIKRCQHSVKEQLSVLLFLYSVLKVHMGGGGRWGGVSVFFLVTGKIDQMWWVLKAIYVVACRPVLSFYSVCVGALDLPRCWVDLHILFFKLWRCCYWISDVLKFKIKKHIWSVI